MMQQAYPHDYTGLPRLCDRALLEGRDLLLLRNIQASYTLSGIWDDGVLEARDCSQLRLTLV